jgi:hypothetical protein
MKRSTQIPLGILSLLMFVIAGCAQVPKESGFGDVQKLIHQKIDYRLHWNQGSTADEQVVRAINDLLKNELTVGGAVQIALLNNQHLQAVYEDLGVTQADVVEAGLLENPVFFGQARFPDKSPSMTNLEFEVSQNFLNILMLPARKKLAAMQFEEVKLRVADEVLKLTAEVREASEQLVHHRLNKCGSTSLKLLRLLMKWQIACTRQAISATLAWRANRGITSRPEWIMPKAQHWSLNPVSN